MSTVIATYDQFSDAHGATLRLLREGVAPDALSLITTKGKTEEEIATVGDATYLVGASDDPEPELDPAPSAPFSEFTTVNGSPIGGIDTSDSDVDVDTVDQAEDSQELVDRDTYDPPISQGEHERDDLNLTLLTGFPTTVPVIQDRARDETELQEGFAEALDLLVPRGGGRVYGGGGLATAALGGILEGNDLHAYLRQEGVDHAEIEELMSRLKSGSPLLAVEVSPGIVNEEAIEVILQEHGADSVRLYDAPRFYEHGRAPS